MRTSLAHVALALIAGGTLASTARAGGVRIVSALGDLNFPDIASAVAAAQDGDVLLVGQGGYGGFTVDGKSLSIWAATGATVTLSGPVTVRHLSADQGVTLVGLHATGTPSTASVSDTLLLLEDNQGHVRLEDCSFLGGSISGWNCIPWDGGYGAKVVDSDRVAFLRCQLRGTEGQEQDPQNGSCFGGKGGTALSSVRSGIACYGCEFTGGAGGQAKYLPGDGGPGLVAIDSQVFTSGGFIRGGKGGYGYGFGDSAAGGHGAAIGDTSAFDVLDCQLVGGAGDPPGLVLVGAANRHPGTARGVDAPTIVPELAPVSVELEGLAGDAVWLPRGLAPGHALSSSLHGVWLLATPLHATKAPQAVLTTPVTTVSLPPFGVLPGAAHRAWGTQGLFRSPGQVTLGDARLVLALSLTVGPDCDGNGTSDYVDVLFGGAPDANHNLIPDGCPGG